MRSKNLKGLNDKNFIKLETGNYKVVNEYCADILPWLVYKVIMYKIKSWSKH